MQPSGWEFCRAWRGMASWIDFTICFVERWSDISNRETGQLRSRVRWSRPCANWPPVWSSRRLRDSACVSIGQNVTSDSSGSKVPTNRGAPARFPSPRGTPSCRRRQALPVSVQRPLYRMRYTEMTSSKTWRVNTRKIVELLFMIFWQRDCRDLQRLSRDTAKCGRSPAAREFARGGP